MVNFMEEIKMISAFIHKINFLVIYNLPYNVNFKYPETLKTQKIFFKTFLR